MSVSVAEFKELFPEFAGKSDESLQFALDCVVENVSEAVFGECYKRAVYLLLAHTVTMQGRGGATGAITSESVGSLSRSYGSLTSTSFLTLTGYGTQYLGMVRLYCSGGSVIC
jgi:hypothetical protein